MRIQDYPAATEITNDNKLLLDTEDGTKSVSAEVLKEFTGDNDEIDLGELIDNLVKISDNKITDDENKLIIDTLNGVFYATIQQLKDKIVSGEINLDNISKVLTNNGVHLPLFNSVYAYANLLCEGEYDNKIKRLQAYVGSNSDPKFLNSNNLIANTAQVYSAACNNLIDHSFAKGSINSGEIINVPIPENNYSTNILMFISLYKANDDSISQSALFILSIGEPSNTNDSISKILNDIYISTTSNFNVSVSVDTINRTIKLNIKVSSAYLNYAFYFI